MPTPDRTSLPEIVAAARSVLESDGLAALTMQSVAKRVGVRAPSLYKRLQNREELIQLVAEDGLTELARCLNRASTPLDLANIFREFGHSYPAVFQLILTPGSGTPAARPEFGIAASATVLRLAGTLAGEAHALEAARTLTAWAVGFISMELNAGFNLGGDVENAWQFGVTRIIAALTSAGDD